MAQAAADQAYAVAMQAGGSMFILPADEIDEVMLSPRLTRVPNGPASLEGVANLRGVVLPVFSLARLLDLPHAAREKDDRSRIVVLREARMGVSVDAVAAAADGGRQRTAASRLAAADLIARAALAAPRSSARRVTPGRHEPASSGRATTDKDVALLGFEIADQTYALPLSNVEEVLRRPRAAAIVTSDAASLGVMDLRGAVLPLMSLRVLLGLSTAGDDTTRHVVVARLGEMRVGFAVDALTSVMRAPESALSATPAILNRGGGEARVASLYRAGGGRLIAVLSPDLLFADKSVVQAAGHPQQESRAMAADASESREQIVVFRLGDEEYGLPISAVDEITRLPDAVTRVPNAPAFIDGVMNLRGRAIPLIDQAKRFGAPARAEGGLVRQRVIVARLGEIEVGFVVDGVTDILSLSAAQTPPAPAMGTDFGGNADQESGQTFDRVAMLEVGGRMILLVDPKELLNRLERDTLQALASQQLRDAS